MAFFPPHIHQFYIIVIPQVSEGLLLISTGIKERRLMTLPSCVFIQLQNSCYLKAMMEKNSEGLLVYYLFSH